MIQLILQLYHSTVFFFPMAQKNIFSIQLIGFFNISFFGILYAQLSRN